MAVLADGRVAETSHKNPNSTSLDTKAPDERTLGGKAVGYVWDTVAGKATDTQSQSDRAQKADHIAEIAADTLASIPRLKTFTAGLSRAVLLADVSGDNGLAGFTTKFALDAAQGALLNKAVRLTTGLGANRALDFKSEMGVHALSGASFGAIKGAFDLQGARDANGDFSTGKWLQNTLQSTAVGGAIGVPAGFMGSYVGKAVSFRLGQQAEQSAIGMIAKNSLVGGTSGFAGGAVFGGVDAARQGHSLKDVMSATLEGGAVGFATGFAAGGFDRTGHKSPSARHLEAQPELAARRHDDVKDVMRARELTERLFPEDRKALAFEKMQYRVSDILDIPLKDLALRLKPSHTEGRSFLSVKDSLPSDQAAFNQKVAALKSDGEFTWEKFWQMTNPENRTVQVMQVDGHSARIILPQEYAVRLDEIRQLRLIAEKPSPFDQLDFGVRSRIGKSLAEGDATVLAPYMTPKEISETIPVMQARFKLQEHPLSNRALPEDYIPILDALPNPGLIKEIVLHDHPNYSDFYKKIVYEDPGFKAAAVVGRDGQVSYFEPRRGQQNVINTFHEWSHLTKWSSPEFSRLFDMAARVDLIEPNVQHKKSRQQRANDPQADHDYIIEDGPYYPNEHSSRNNDENWAVNKGEELMGADPTGLFILAEKAPVRALILKAALEQSFKAGRASKSSAESANGVFDPQLRERIAYIDKAARPLAEAALRSRLRSGTTDEKGYAAKLLGLVGDESSVPALLKIAQDRSMHVKPSYEGIEGTFKNGEGEFTVAQMAFDSAVKLQARTASDGVDYAFSLGRDHPNLRDVAESYLRRTTDPAGNRYASFLNVLGKESHLSWYPRILEGAMRYDPVGRKMMLEEMSQLTSRDHAKRVELLLHVYERVPEARIDVLDHLARTVRTGVTPIDLTRIDRAFRDSRADQPLHEQRLEELKAMTAKEIAFNKALEGLKRSDTEQLQSVEYLGSSGDHRAVKPLILKAVGASEAVQQAASRALANYNSRLIKFSARELSLQNHDNPVITQRIADLQRQMPRH